jgi:hypothetical protein
MATFRVKRGLLYIDFRWRGVRCREATRLLDTPEHRADTRRKARQIDGEIAAGTFDYAKWFPRGPHAVRFAAPVTEGPPLYQDTVRRWLADKSLGLRLGRPTTDAASSRGSSFPSSGSDSSQRLPRRMSTGSSRSSSAPAPPRPEPLIRPPRSGGRENSRTAE